MRDCGLDPCGPGWVTGVSSCGHGNGHSDYMTNDWGTIRVSRKTLLGGRNV
jgi:hypothetical protein